MPEGLPPLPPEHEVDMFTNCLSHHAASSLVAGVWRVVPYFKTSPLPARKVIFRILNNLKIQFSRVNAFKYCVVEMEFSSNR